MSADILQVFEILKQFFKKSRILHFAEYPNGKEMSFNDNKIVHFNEKARYYEHSSKDKVKVAEYEEMHLKFLFTATKMNKKLFITVEKIKS